MKILILSPRLPYARGKADSMTVYRIIRYFSQRHDVYLACFYSDPSELSHVQELEELCREVRCIKLNKVRAGINMARALLNRGFPLQVAYYYDSRMRGLVSDMIQRCKPDLTYAHLIRMAGYLKDEEGIRILAMQISQTLNYRRLISNIHSGFYKMLYRMEYRRVCSYEPAITRSFDSCLLISKHDKESLAGHERIDNVFYSPHGVDVEFYTETESVEKENAIMFCGVLETPTNMDAVLFFYHDIYPLIKRRIADVRFYLVGKNPPSVIRKIAEEDSSVIVTGYVDDTRPYYSRAKVGIDPLRIGAGLQNKLLIGMSMGQPMVCTSIANEGIAAKEGLQVLIADTPVDFADRVVELLTNDRKRAMLARNARKYVEEKWTWEYYFKQLEAHFEKITKEE